MVDIIDFFQNLFATAHWPARWHCGTWSDFHGWLYISSDIAIWLSYYAIPVIILGYMYKKKSELKYLTTYVLFAFFILLCGSTHLLDAVMFWMPMYRLSALVKFLTGAVSLFTVYHLFKILPDAFRQKTSVVLEREIARRIEAEQKLEIANAGLQQFVYMASHDIQEPLRKVEMYTSRLYESNKPNLDEKSQDLVAKTIRVTERMRKMINGFLQLSALADNVTLQPVDLNEVFNQCISDLEIKVSERSAKITISQLPLVLGHADYLVIAFTNLIGNAIKFSTREPVIDISSTINGDKVNVHIRDNGIGIAVDSTEKIFKPFERLHNRTSYEGSGIGLAIVKKVIDLHKGEITLTSEPGIGSTFSITLSGV